jgi:hypothetical protein
LLDSGPTTLYDQCIEAFRPKHPEQGFFDGPNGGDFGYILSDFEILADWDLSNCKMASTIRYELGRYIGLISKVHGLSAIPSNNHQFCQALASILTFSTGRLFKVPDDDFYRRSGAPFDDIAMGIAMNHLLRGPGADELVASRFTQEFQKSSFDLIKALNAVPYGQYVEAMQAIRLAYLSRLNKREDFGLAYHLIVAAIEAIAQLAVKTSVVRVPHSKEADWEAKKGADPDFDTLLAEYKQVKSNNKLLTQKYLHFIKQHAPLSSWQGLLPAYEEVLNERIKEFERFGASFNIVKSQWDIHPEELTEQFAYEALKDSYKYRSGFVHRGEQPPNKGQNPFARYFETMMVKTGPDGGHSYQQKIMPSYDLLFALAQKSITAWVQSKVPKS